MKKLSLTTLAVLSTCNALAYSYLAEEPEDKPTPVIVVTGTLTEKILSESPVPIEVISEQTLEEKGVVRLDEVLKDVPGIQLQSMHGQQGQSIIMQGMNAEHVLVMIDGVPVNQTDSEINLERLNLANVERIEIVPGSSSALYGSSAMGGVINLITRKKNEPYFKAETGLSKTENHVSYFPTEIYGSIQTGHALLNGFLDHSLALTRYDGFDVDPDTFTEQIAGGYRWTLNESFRAENLAATLMWNAGRLERPYTEQVANNFIKKIKVENSHEISTSLKHQTDSTEQLVQLDIDVYETVQDIVSTEDTLNFVRNAQAYAGRASYTWNTGFGSHLVSLGGVVSGETLNQVKTQAEESDNEIDDRSRYSIEGFIQDDWFALDSLEIITGARAQWDSGFGSFFSPKIATRWDAWQGTSADVYVRASTGLGYRVPNLKERFYEFDHSHLGYIVTGNESVEPESSLSTQLEVGGTLAVGFVLWEWSINSYRQNVTNLMEYAIDESVIDPELTVGAFTTQNIGKALIQGADLTLKIPFEFAGQTFSHSLSYQILEATDETTGLPLNSRPEYALKLTQRLQTTLPGDAVFTTNLNVIGEQWVDAAEDEKAESYLTIDSNAQFQLSDAWQINAGIKNLTNKYNESESYDVTPTLGRTYEVTLRFQP